MRSLGGNIPCNLTPQLQNPLLNHLILENLFGFVKHFDLKSARHVCSIWNKTATGFLHGISHVHLFPENLQDYVELFQDGPSLHRHSKFHLHGFDLKNSNIVYPAMALFLEKFGNSVKEIVFSKCVFPNSALIWTGFSFLKQLEIVSFGDSYQEIENEVQVATKEESGQLILGLPTCPNVVSLEIVNGIKGNFATWTNIFKVFPNIKSLQVQLQKPFDLTEMLTALTQAESPILLTDFCSYIQLGANHLQLLTTISQKLENIDIIVEPKISPEFTIGLLDSCKDKLKTLKLSSAIDENEAAPKFPFRINFPNLRNLEINQALLESFNFLQSTPNLRSVFILQDDAEEDEVPHSQLVQETPNQNADNVEAVVSAAKLEALSMQFFLSPSCIQRLGVNLCPNIKKLSVYLDDESIRAVYTYLPNLEELWVLGTEITDEGLTGISFHVLLSEDLKPKANYREFPYIGQCKKLRKFGLYSQPQENISDYSVRYGLLDLKELTCLDLPQTAISDKGIRTLRKNSNIVSLGSKFFVEDGRLIKRSEKLQVL